MSQCPVCKTEIEGAFGLVQCPGCEAMLVAEFDGSLKEQSDAEPDLEANSSEEASSSSFSAIEPSGSVAGSLSHLEESSFETLEEVSFEPVESKNEVKSEGQGESQGLEEEALFFTEENSGESSASEKASWSPEENFESSPEPIGDSFDEVNSEKKADAEVTPSDQLQEISDFANSEKSKLSEGDLIYDLLFENISSKEVVREILSVVKMPHFSIHQNNILIKDTLVRVSGVNPVKLSAIVSQLKYLPVEISWEQSSLTL